MKTLAVLSVLMLALAVLAPTGAAALSVRPPALAGWDEEAGGAAAPPAAPAVAGVTGNDRELPTEVWVDDGYSAEGGNDGHTWGTDAFSLIQAGIDGVAPGGTVYVAAGTYTENVIANKTVNILGAGAATTTLYPATSEPGGDDGPSFSGSQILVVQAHDVEIAGLSLDGDNPALTSGVVRNGADVDARNGIIEGDGPWDYLHVHDCTIRNIYLRALYARSGGSGFYFHQNTLDNVTGGYASIAIFGWMASGVIEANNVSRANDAISANHSRGIQFLNNHISQSSSGIHTDNNGSSGGVADVISGNTVVDSTPGGYGIWIFFPYLNATASGNTVTNVDYSLFAWGGAGGTATFTSNQVDGQGRPGSIGIYVTTGPDAWATWQSNVAVSLVGNTVSNVDYGMYLETDEDGTYDLTASASGQTFTDAGAELALAGLGDFALTGVASADVAVFAPGRIQLGIDVATAGGRVVVGAGTYHERLVVTKPLSLLGAQLGVDPTPPEARTDPADESLVDLVGVPLVNPNVLLEIPAGVTDVSVSGFTLAGSEVMNWADEDVIRFWDDRMVFEDNILTGYYAVHGRNDNDGFDLRRNRITANKVGLTFQNAGSDVEVVGNTFVPGNAPAADAAAVYLTGVSGALIQGNTAAGFSAGNGLGGSNVTQLQILDNTFSNCRKAVSFWGNTTFINVEGNVIIGSLVNGINIKGQDITIRANIITGTGGDAVAIDKDTLVTERVSVVGNDLSGNAGYGLSVTSLVTEAVDGSANWWGVTDPAAVAEKTSGLVDFTPWLNVSTDISGEPGFQGDHSVLWVDDAGEQTGTIGRIREAISLVSGSTVNILPGTYSERDILVDRPITLHGDAGGDCPGAGPNAPVIDGGHLSGNGLNLAEGVDHVLVEGLVLRNFGTAPTSPGQGCGFRAYNPSTDPCTDITVRRCDFEGNAWADVFFFNEAQSAFDDIEVSCNLVTKGPWSPNTNVYGIECTNCTNALVLDNVITGGYEGILMTTQTFGSSTVSSSGTGSRIEGNTISGSAYRCIELTAFAGATTAASPVLEGVVIRDNLLQRDNTTLFVWPSSWGSGYPTSYVRDLTIEDNDFTVTGPTGSGNVVDLNAGGMSSFSGNTVTVAGSPFGGFVHGLNLVALGNEASGTWTIDGNAFDGNDLGGGSSGIRLRDTLGAAAVVDISNNTLTGWSDGVRASDLPSGATVTLRYNSLYGNATYGAENTTTGAPLDAMLNWWGHASGPYHATLNPAGTGNPVSDNVIFQPFSAGNIVCLPDPQQITSADAGGLEWVTLRYLGGLSGPLYGFSLRLSLPAELDIQQILKPLTGPFATAQIFQTVDQGSIWILDAAIGGANPGTEGACDLARVQLKALDCASAGATLDLTALSLRDSYNHPLSGGEADDALIYVDLDDPEITAVSLVRTNLPNTGYVKNGDTMRLTATVANPCGGLDGLEITADLSALGGPAAAPAASVDPATGLATWDDFVVTGSSEGEKTVAITAVDGLGNDATLNPAATVTVDNTPPTAMVTDLDAAPGHNEISLGWTNPTGDPDLDTYGILLRRAGQGDYPEYELPLAAYPDTATGTRVLHAPGMPSSFLDDSFPGPWSGRDIYSYQAFVFDKAYNYGPGNENGSATDACDRATSYWLGDVDPKNATPPTTIGDGLVQFSFDVSGGLTPTYYQPEGGTYWNAHCDVGPTDDASRVGIPQPDNQIDFEDLMIFAMNYGVVTPLQGSAPGVLASAVPPSVQWRVAPGTGELVGRLVLANNRGMVKGAHALVRYDASQLELLAVEKGALAQPAGVFFACVRQEGALVLDVAQLGEGLAFAGSGELAVVRFRARGNARPVLAESEVRTVLNHAPGWQPEVAEATALSGDGAKSPEAPAEVTTPALPAVIAFHGAAPNPFTGSTELRFALPSESAVTLQIYDVSGRMVRVLAADRFAAGEHRLTWDGRADGGARLGAGLYFARFQTGSTQSTTKLFLTR